jgi:hypothetical protein
VGMTMSGPPPVSTQLKRASRKISFSGAFGLGKKKDKEKDKEKERRREEEQSLMSFSSSVGDGGRS